MLVIGGVLLPAGSPARSRQPRRLFPHFPTSRVYLYSGVINPRLLSADCQRMASETANQLGGIDVLVNNAGIIAVGAVAEMAEEAWDRVMAVNAKGPFLCAKACIPYLQRNREGAIVNTASIAGKTGRGFVSAYCASKFAVVAFTQSLAEELGPSNIPGNAVCPGR